MAQPHAAHPGAPVAFLDINDNIIANVRQAADIVEFISFVTPLKQAGRSYKGLCPFHREKTPSFHVDRAKGLFYCFGCGAGGDVFKFLMRTERYTFPEAVEHVANRVGIEIPKKSKGRDEAKDELLEIIDEAAMAFHQALAWKPNAAETYLRQRGVDEQIWNKYGFGYAPESWDYLLSRLGRKYKVEQLEKAGLVVPRREKSGHYDRFRNRLMIPIHNEAGTIIGFGGRSLDGTDPKYLNSPETQLFNKSTLLFNYFRARDQIRKMERAVLVEGYFDCIALDHAGVPGVVASMGTSLTPGQASLLRRIAKQVVIAYDGDNAGRNAALRAAPILLSAGLSVGIIDLGDGQDPDTFIRDFGIAGFMEKLSTAQEVFQFAIHRWIDNAQSMTGRQKSEVLDQFVPLVGAVSDPVIKNDAAQRIADALRLDFETIWSKVRGRGLAKTTEGRAARAPIPSGEKLILRAALSQQLPISAAERIREEYFEDPSCKTIFGVIRPALLEGQTLDFSAIAAHLRGEAELTTLSELALGDENVPLTAEVIESILRPMEHAFLNSRLKNISIDHQEAERKGDESRMRELDAEKTELMRQLRTLK
jgi:DNA primase